MIPGIVAGSPQKAAPFVVGVTGASNTGDSLLIPYPVGGQEGDVYFYFAFARSNITPGFLFTGTGGSPVNGIVASGAPGYRYTAGWARRGATLTRDLYATFSAAQNNPERGTFAVCVLVRGATTVGDPYSVSGVTSWNSTGSPTSPTLAVPSSSHLALVCTSSSTTSLGTQIAGFDHAGDYVTAVGESYAGSIDTKRVSSGLVSPESRYSAPAPARGVCVGIAVKPQ